jgi:hypothetical protein
MMGLTVFRKKQQAERSTVGVFCLLLDDMEDIRQLEGNLLFHQELFEGA